MAKASDDLGIFGPGVLSKANFTIKEVFYHFQPSIRHFIRFPLVAFPTAFQFILCHIVSGPGTGPEMVDRRLKVSYGVGELAPAVATMGMNPFTFAHGATHRPG
jgi:hypothetical protein